MFNPQPRKILQNRIEIISTNDCAITQAYLYPRKGCFVEAVTGVQLLTVG